MNSLSIKLQSDQTGFDKYASLSTVSINGQGQFEIIYNVTYKAADGTAFSPADPTKAIINIGNYAMFVSPESLSGQSLSADQQATVDANAALYNQLIAAIEPIITSQVTK